MSYAEWERDSRDFAAFLVEEANCRPGDRVAIMLPNMLAYPVTFLGALRAGMTVVNVNPLYTPRELQEQLADSGAIVIVIMENFAHKLQDDHRRHENPARRRGAARRFRADAQALGVQFREFLHQARACRPGTSKHSRCCRMRATGRRASAIEDAPARGASDVALLQYTGGTTGVAKGAMLTHRNLIANTLQCCAWTGAGVDVENERVLTPLPLYHIFSLTANLLSFAVLGGLNFLIPDPRDLHRLIRTMRARQDHLDVRRQHAVQRADQRARIRRAGFQRAARRDRRRRRGADRSGAALARDHRQRAGRRLRPDRSLAGRLHQSVSRAEASAPSACRCRRPKSPSATMPAKCLPSARQGEVWVRGPQVMLGYWQRPDETAQC